MLEASQKFTDFMLASFVPMLQKQIKSVKIPDQKGKASGFDYHVSSMKVKTVDLSKTKITFKKSQGLAISVPFHIEGALLQRGSPQPAGLLPACARSFGSVFSILTKCLVRHQQWMESGPTSCTLSLTFRKEVGRSKLKRVAQAKYRLSCPSVSQKATRR